MESKEAFRDQLYHTDTSGRRIGFFPKRPRGRYYSRRILVSLILLVIMFGLPWLKSGGEPLFLLNVIERKFTLFGHTFWPQDFALFAVLMVSIVVFVLLFTAILGRIWCGWTCPQTVFLEMVYRRIEFWIEGDSAAQRRLSNAPWTFDKVRKRVMKHAIFLAIAGWVSHTVLAYVVGMDTVLAYIRTSPGEYPVTFGAVVVNTGVFYFVFAWFREQACIYFCPYGRLQGVMLDRDTLVISYDHNRGEPRAKLKKSQADPSLGDCIDCRQCVAVCPTGIDIRNGTQLECVNCTACIDACDEIMDKVNRPRGLVRYASEKQIETGKKFKLTPRAYLYGGVLAVLWTVFVILFINAGDLNATLLRKPGQTFTMTPEGNVTNLYTLKLVNKLEDARELDFRLKDTDGKITVLGSDVLKLPGAGLSEAALLVELPKNSLKGLSFDLKIEMLEKGEVIKTFNTKFNGPNL